FRIGSLPENLPLTIQRAIQIVEASGYQYLWVDSICIDQSNKFEKHDQIKLMGEIYWGAYATIIALSSDTANFGIHGAEDSLLGASLSGHYRKHIMAARCPSLLDELKNSIWFKRTWTFQAAFPTVRITFDTFHFITVT
ncbi:heterokaryon incompatibility, partial [Clohesyomyces aquaticus]